jgi:hypothetical protein
LSDEVSGLPATRGSPSGGVPARRPDPPPPETNKVKQAWAWWLTKAVKIGAKQNRVFAWLAYFIGMAPVGFWIRRQDRLDRAQRSASPTAWHPREGPISVDPMRIKRPF